MGGLLLGAAAGAGTGYAVSKNNKNHKTVVVNNPNAASGSFGCGQDKGQQLIFHITLAFDFNIFFENVYCDCTEFPDPGIIRITSFVVSPSGSMTTGKTDMVKLQRGETRIKIPILNEEVLVPTDSSLLKSTLLAYDDVIAIVDPYFGTYNFGLQIEFNNLPTLSLSLIGGEVKATRTQTTTAIPISMPMSFGATGLTFTQATGTFEYSPPNGVPSIRELLNR